VRPAVYIPTHDARGLLARVLGSLAEQTRSVDVVVIDNGSTDGSEELVRADFPEVEIVAFERNLGFGPAINRALEARPADPVILVNNDAECEPRFVEALLEAAEGGAQMAAGILLQERDPGLIDSAGVVADRTLMGFDHLSGEPVSALEDAAPPLGPTGGAALYSGAALKAVGGFDERIFLYNEDLDLALRIAAAGGRCRLAPGARALHAHSASLGAATGRKYAMTGWSRGYMLRRYGVMSSPTAALRVLACEGALCAGQLLRDHTLQGLRGRLRGWRDAAGLQRREAEGVEMLEISAREALRRRRRMRMRGV
jgi:N-acetylglucosaminyl-diphospho-decaprenol L-rhamnosyltransferase